MKVNEGEVPQYYVENSHPAIITPEVFDLVQYELEKRKNVKGYKTCGSCFSGKIVCSECGGFYGSKVWHSTSKYRRVIWQCNHKFKNDKKCKTSHLYEDTIKEAFLEAFNSLLESRDEILQGYEAIIHALTDTSKLDKESAKLQSEREVAAELLRKCVEENAYNALDQADYQHHYDEMATQYEASKKRLYELNEQRLDRRAKREKMVEFIATLSKRDGLLAEFDESLWTALVESVTVHDGRNLIFKFKDGTELTWTI